jgi:NADH-quinone oxidoreductase subunit N
VLAAAVQAGMTWLAVAGVIASVIGAFYYLRIVFYMYFGEKPALALDGKMSMVTWVFLMAAAVIMLAGVVNLFGIEAPAFAAAAALAG